jgi:hypothetical protein
MTEQQETQEQLQKELHSFRTQLAYKFQWLDHMSIAYKDQPEMLKKYVEGMKHDRRLITEWEAKLAQTAEGDGDHGKI